MSSVLKAQYFRIIKEFELLKDTVTTFVAKLCLSSSNSLGPDLEDVLQMSEHQERGSQQSKSGCVCVCVCVCTHACACIVFFTSNLNADTFFCVCVLSYRYELL